VTWSDLLPVALLYALVLAAWFGFGWRLGRAGFYALFAVTVTASVQLVGIYLVFGTLILPALAAHGRQGAAGLALGYATGAAGYVAGFAVTTTLDLPAGPAIVCALAAAAALIRTAQSYRPDGSA
jgi:zinc/manganese transport system permease protein